MSEVKTVGILTSGGDAPGMNAAIRAAVRTARASGMKVKGIRRGYAGLLNNEIIDMDSRMVSEIARIGGTILFTARCKEFETREGQEKGAQILKDSGIDGDGSFRGAQRLSALGINTIGIPGTIDLDINCTDYTIGFDTAVNTAVSAIDKIKDTSASHERCSIIEVMGRNAGYIALWCQMANGADGILIPEREAFDEQDLIDTIMHNRAKGKTHHVIINAEGVGHTNRLARRIEAATGIETRATVLGHIQRGGSPTVRDRVNASLMGYHAVDLLDKGIYNRVVALSGGKIVDYDVNVALSMHKYIDPMEIEVAQAISI
mgnify:CR=1 FL=1